MVALRTNARYWGRTALDADSKERVLLYFLVHELAPAGGRSELAKIAYRSRAEAEAALRLRRGRWRILTAQDWVQAAQRAKAVPLAATA